MSIDARGRQRRRAGSRLKTLSPVMRRFVPRARATVSPGPATPPAPRAPRLPGRRIAPLDRHTPTFGTLGTLEVRLARTTGEVKRAQNVRYRVFYEEMAAQPNPYAMATRRDRDRFDAICDHLLVVDNADDGRRFRKTKPAIVGTYRLLRHEIAEQHGGFYSAAEFDIAPVLQRHSDKRFLELGRSCVLRPYRNKRTVELLWHGAWSYVLRHNIDVMFGCASLVGTDPDELATALAFLHHNAMAPDEWRIRALNHRYVSLNRLPADAVDPKVALRALPPLIKGYLRLGAFVGDGAVIDHQFGTIDVMMVLPVAGISHRYINYYGADASRHA